VVLVVQVVLLEMVEILVVVQVRQRQMGTTAAVAGQVIGGIVLKKVVMAQFVLFTVTVVHFHLQTLV
jgi:hypothetical protein